MFFNFTDHSVEFDPEKLSFNAFGSNGEKFISNARISIHTQTQEHRELHPDDFASFRDEEKLELESYLWKRVYTGGPIDMPELEFGFKITKEYIRFFCLGRAYVGLDGQLCWGADPEHSTFSIRRDAQEPILKTSSGPAVSSGDNALFDRLTDSLLACTTAGDLHFRFDWNASSYAFHYSCGFDFGRELEFRIIRNYCANKFHIPYAPISKKHGFDTPPVGWMTWYSVQFAACEEIVLRNAKEFMQHFGAYTEKPVLWVDWEWCHNAWDGQGEKGSDIFHPRKAAYPRGLKAVSDDLKAMGMTPALWIGATNEGQKNELLEQHPDWILAKKALWCGQWWIDPSHPDVIGTYIPAVFRQILDWGFRVIKWDCFPATFEVLCAMHDKFHDPSQTPHQAFRNMVKKARETVGDDIYMLSCSGTAERDICGAMDLFDAARIGGDIFSWDDFIEQGLNRILFASPWHNTVLYSDADNLILRAKFSNPEQARTRVSIYGLAGVPVTMGDEIHELDEQRIDMLRRIMPVVDIHPGELDSKRCGRFFLIENLAIARPFAEWNVTGITNLTAEKRRVSIDLPRDCRLERGKYAVYDFWNKEYLGIFSTSLELELKAYDTRVLRITPVNDSKPTLISISRHLTQGGYELKALKTEANRISGTVICAADEPCKVTILLPENRTIASADVPAEQQGNTVVLTLKSDKTAPISWSLEIK